MLVLKCNIEIIGKGKNNSENTKISFDYVSSVVVKTSCKSLSDTADIVLPRKMQEKASNPLRNKRDSIVDYIKEKKIKRGDEVTIQLGYEEFGLKPVFKGYILHIEQGNQLTIKCEDKTFLLKENVFPCNYTEFNFVDFFRDNEGKIGTIDFKDNSNQIFGGMKIEEHLRVDQALDKVIKTYPTIRIFFRYDKYKDGREEKEASEKLYITESTKPVLDKNKKAPIVFSPEHNILNDSKLTYVDAGDLNLIMTAETIADCEFVNFKDEKKENGANKTDEGEGKEDSPKYKKISSSFPKVDDEKGYEKRVFIVRENISKALFKKGEKQVEEKDVKDELEKYAKGEYELLKTDRVSGSFTAFGEPFVQKGDLVEFQYGDLRPEMNGKVFIVDAVDYSFGKDGYRQTITLGYQTEPENKTTKS